MLIKKNNKITFQKAILNVLKSEKIITNADLTWLANECISKGSSIQRNIIYSAFMYEAIIPNRFEEEAKFIDLYFRKKLSMTRAFRKKTNNIQFNLSKKVLNIALK